MGTVRERPPARSTTRTVRATSRPSADDTRGRILAAALDLFSERSFEGATTREIAVRAGVTQPLLNYHFHGKEELWRAAIDSLFDRLTTVLDTRLTGLRGVDERTVTELVVREFVLFSAANPQLHRIITQECKADGPRIDWLVETHIRPLYDAMADRLRRLSEAGLAPAVPPAHLYYILTGAAATMFVLAPECRRLSGVDPSDPAVAEQHADAVLSLLFGTGNHSGHKEL
ncbi:MAG: TetR/AcrR family transcriptional regulator [Acidimicrobiales bacterium]|jgi:AcrR family transcriptional regulator|nr:TetR/AcrR family transcriptional regulator [Acidimicrobiales bacterium]